MSECEDKTNRDVYKSGVASHKKRGISSPLCDIGNASSPKDIAHRLAGCMYTLDSDGNAIPLYPRVTGRGNGRNSLKDVPLCPYCNHRVSLHTEDGCMCIIDKESTICNCGTPRSYIDEQI
jgi:hypothetical protein